MPLGYRNHADWRDMSEYVVHFAGAGEESAYDQMLSILSSRSVQAANAFGAARRLGALDLTQRCACFSEIPLDRLNRLVEHRGPYGIGFHQKALVAAGGGRVWYVDKDSCSHVAIQELMRERIGPPMAMESPLWQVTPFIDFPGDYGGAEYHFEWEREWRVPGGFEFDVAEVRFLFIPEEQHKNARKFFEQARIEHSGPSYTCPFLDPLWDDDRIQEALAGVTAP